MWPCFPSSRWRLLTTPCECCSVIFSSATTSKGRKCLRSSKVSIIISSTVFGSVTVCVWVTPNSELFHHQLIQRWRLENIPNTDRKLSMGCGHLAVLDFNVTVDSFPFYFLFFVCFNFLFLHRRSFRNGNKAFSKKGKSQIDHTWCFNQPESEKTLACMSNVRSFLCWHKNSAHSAKTYI